MVRQLFVLIARAIALFTATFAPFVHAAPLIDPEKTLQQNLETFYPVAVQIIIFLAFLGVIYAGYLYITSFGQQDRITEAKNWLIAAVTGVVLVILIPVIIREIEKLPIPGR